MVYQKPEVNPVHYLQVDIDEILFNRIFDSHVLQFKINFADKYTGSFANKNKFIRFNIPEKPTWYMDINILKIVIQENIIILLGSKIDYKKPRKL